MSLCWSDLNLAPDRWGLYRRLAGWCAAGVALVAPAAMGRVRLGVVSGSSMCPTFRSGQPFVFRKWSMDAEPLQRGDLVVVRLGGVICIKRVFALERDRFFALTIDGKPSESTALVAVGDPLHLWKARFPRFGFVERRVPHGCVFVVGDAVARSVDSRQLGPIPMSDVLGRVIWPPSPPAPPGGPIAYWCDQPRIPRPRAHGSLVPSIRRTATCQLQSADAPAHPPRERSL